MKCKYDVLFLISIWETINQTYILLQFVFLFSDVTKTQSNRSTSYVCADLFLQFLCAFKDLWQVTAAREDIDEKKQENIHI